MEFSVIEEPKNTNYKFADGATDTYYDGKERRKQAKSILLGRH